MKNYSESCDRNKQPILAVLRREFQDTASVLEIGSGSGQHAIYFSQHFPKILWRPSERARLVADLRENLKEVELPNLAEPITLNVDQFADDIEATAAVFSANTLHIIPLASVENFFRLVGSVLLPKGLLCVYGPFRYAGAYTSESNQKFDAWLKRRDPRSGIRDFEFLDELASQQDLKLRKDYPMPSNNQLLVWQRAFG